MRYRYHKMVTYTLRITDVIQTKHIKEIMNVIGLESAF
jgi:hypothetical protein